MLPSQHNGGKPAHDDDFRAGFAAGVKGLAKPSTKTAAELYRKVSSKYGQWWISGYNAALDWNRGFIDTHSVRIARELGLSLAASMATRVRGKNAKIGRAAVAAGLPKARDSVRIKYDRDPLRARGIAMEPAREVTGYMDGTQLVTNDHRETPWGEHKREGNVIMLHTYRAGAVDGWMVGVVSGRSATFKGRTYRTAALAKIAFRNAIKAQPTIAMGRMV